MKFQDMKTPADLLARSTYRTVAQNTQVLEISVGNKWLHVKHLTSKTRVSPDQTKVCIRYCARSGGTSTTVRYI